MRLKQLFHTLETLEMSDFATEKPCKQTESIQRKCNVPHVARNVWPSALRTFFTHLLFIKTKKTFFILLSTRLSLSLSIVNNTAWSFFSARQDKFFIYNEYEYTIPPSPLSLSNDFPPCNGRQKARIQEGRP